MELALVGVIAIVCIVAVNTFAPRVGIASPLVLVLLGVVVSLIPAVPAVEVDPELILAGILPPLLYSTAVSMPAMDFRRDFRTISGLSVGLVVLSSVGAGFLFAWLIPDIDLATGIALGAIISPTDAVATTIVRRLGVSPRLVTILEGESLLNDASALVLLRSAVAAAAGAVSLWGVAGDFVFAVVVAVAIGIVVGRLNLVVRSRIAESTSNTAISFAVPFLAYLPAEHLGASGLVAAVTAGLITGSGGARYLRAQDRIAQASNWRTIELLLEGAVFLIMGLELYALIVDVEEAHGSVAYAFGLGLLAAGVVIVVRSVYVVVVLLRARQWRRRIPEFRARLDAAKTKLDNPSAAPPRMRPSQLERARLMFARRRADIEYLLSEPMGWREGTVLVWAGMRGAVTLAAAQSLPPDTPQRSLLVLIAFTVAAGTLLVQGGTLPFLVGRLGLRRPDRDDDLRAYESDPETAALLADLDSAASQVLDAADGTELDGRPVSRRVIERIRRESIHHGQIDPEEPAGDSLVTRQQYRDLRLAVIRAQREALVKARSEGSYGSATLEAVLDVLDADQISLELRGGSAPGDD